MTPEYAEPGILPRPVHVEEPQADGRELAGVGGVGAHALRRQLGAGVGAQRARRRGLGDGQLRRIAVHRAARGEHEPLGAGLDGLADGVDRAPVGDGVAAHGVLHATARRTARPRGGRPPRSRRPRRASAPRRARRPRSPAGRRRPAPPGAQAPSRFSSLPVLKSSSTRTSEPLMSSASTTCDPMNPAPPVTRVSPSMRQSYGTGRRRAAPLATRRTAASRR